MGVLEYTKLPTPNLIGVEDSGKRLTRDSASFTKGSAFSAPMLNGAETASTKGNKTLIFIILADYSFRTDDFFCLFNFLLHRDRRLGLSFRLGSRLFRFRSSNGSCDWECHRRNGGSRSRSGRRHRDGRGAGISTCDQSHSATGTQGKEILILHLSIGVKGHFPIQAQS